jgi:hypothetical protein
MKSRKLITLVTLTALFFWTPTVIPVAHAVTLPCGTHIVWTPFDTANAVPVVIAPCHHGSTWPAWAVIAGAASIILNSIYVAKTQCRELTQQEAMASGFLPFVGFLWNQNHNKCHH